MNTTKESKKPTKKPFVVRIKEFGNTIGRSCYDMEFYRQVRTQPWTRGLIYLLKLMLIVTLAMAIFLGPTIYTGLGKFRGYINSQIPDGASVSLSGGQLSAALPMPLNLSEGEGDKKFIIDTSVVGLDVPREQLGDDGVLIGRDAIFFRENGVEDRTYAFKDFPNFSVNKRQTLNWMDNYTVLVSIVITLVFGLFYYLAITIGNFLFVLFGALLVFLFGRLLKVKLEYTRWLAAGLFAVTLPLVLGAAFDAFGWTRVPIFPVVFFMILASVMADEKARTTKKTTPTLPKSPKEKSKKDDSKK